MLGVSLGLVLISLVVLLITVTFFENCEYVSEISDFFIKLFAVWFLLCLASFFMALFFPFSTTTTFLSTETLSPAATVETIYDSDGEKSSYVIHDGSSTYNLSINTEFNKSDKNYHVEFFEDRFDRFFGKVISWPISTKLDARSSKVFLP